MNPKTITKAVTAYVKGTTAVSLDTVTTVRMVKKDRETKEPNPFLGAVKHQTKNGIIGFDYENSVNNQADREGKEHRETKERAWGTLGPKRIFVYHKDKVYIQIKVQNVTGTKYMLNGVELAYESIKPYLSGSGKSSTQADLDKEVIVNDINLDNVHGLRMGGLEILQKD